MPDSSRQANSQPGERCGQNCFPLLPAGESESPSVRHPKDAPFSSLVFVARSFMVFIFAEFALLGKSFFHPCAGASIERVEFRVDGVDAGQQAIGRNFFADFRAEVFSEVSVAVLVKVADVFCKRGARLDEGFDEFEFGDFHDFIFYDFAFGCKDYFSRSAASCLRSLPMRTIKTLV